MSLLPKLDVKCVLAIVILIWLVSFPVKGVSFQLSLYLLPLLVLTFRQTRSLLKRDSSIILFLSVTFSLPLFLSELWSLIFSGGALSTDPFDVFWRLALFPIVLAVACDYSRFSNQRLQSSLVLFAAIYGLAGIGSSLLHLSLNGRPLGYRTAGIISNSNPFGFLMFAAILIAVQQVLYARTRMRVLVFTLVALLLLFAGVLSGSRSALLGGVLSLVLMLLLQRERLIAFFGSSKKILISAGAIILLLVPILLSQLPHENLLQNHIIKAFSGDIRLQIWQHYLGLVSENPFLGAPLNAARKFHYHGQTLGPHNMYLSVLVHSGSMGLVGLLAGLGWLAKRIIGSDNKDKDLSLALLLLLCLFCFFNSSIFGNEMTQGVFALIIAMTLSGDSLAKEKNSPPLL